MLNKALTTGLAATLLLVVAPANVAQATDTLRMLARVSHNQGESAAKDLDAVADTQEQPKQPEQPKKETKTTKQNK